MSVNKKTVKLIEKTVSASEQRLKVVEKICTDNPNANFAPVPQYFNQIISEAQVGLTVLSGHKELGKYVKRMDEIIRVARAAIKKISEKGL